MSGKLFKSPNNEQLDFVEKLIKEKQGFVKFILEGDNHFQSYGIKKIIEDQFRIDQTIRSEDEKGRGIIKNYIVNFMNLRIERPSKLIHGNKVPMMPANTRNQNLHYIANYTVDMEVKLDLRDEKTPDVVKEKVEFVIPNIKILQLPVSVRSKLCNSTGWDPKTIGEDEFDHGAYYILKGQEWSINNIENSVNNMYRIWKNNKQKQVAQLRFLSKMGDMYENTRQLIMYFYQNGFLGITITEYPFRPPPDTTNKTPYIFPIFAIIRILDPSLTDKDILEYITMISDPSKLSGSKLLVYRAMVHTIYKSYRVLDDGSKTRMSAFSTSIFNKGSRTDYIIALGTYLSSINSRAKFNPANDDDVRDFITKVDNALDNGFLIHIGKEKKFRRRKAEFLCFLINRLLLTSFDIIEQNNRSSYVTKRVDTPNILMAKFVKSYFYNNYVKALAKTISNKIENSVNLNNIEMLLKPRIKNLSINKIFNILIKAITIGDDGKLSVGVGKTINNTLGSMQIKRNNDIKPIDQLRTIKIAAAARKNNNSTTEGFNMRMVDPSYHLFVDPIQSADTGPNVGVKKQLACAAIITNLAFSAQLKEIVLESKYVYGHSEFSQKTVAEQGLTMVFVNGCLLGATDRSWELCHSILKLKRGGGKLGSYLRHVSILWRIDRGELRFSLDNGRLMTPCFVVYNNIRDYELFGLKEPAPVSKFRQMVKYSGPRMLAEMTIDEMFDEGVIEYVAPEDLSWMRLSPTTKHVADGIINPMVQYTHCSPIVSAFGFSSNLAVFSQNNAPARSIFFTNYGKQAVGISTLNWHIRFDKLVSNSLFIERPIVRSFSDRFFNPYGTNLVVLIGPYGGFNEEDSLVISKNLSDRGKMSAVLLNYDKIEIERNEIVGIGEGQSIDRAKNKNEYTHLDENGVAKIGSTLRQGDIIISKYVKLAENIQQKTGTTYRDASVKYTYRYPGTVIDVLKTIGENGSDLYKIQYKTKRDIEEGDKFSSRGGQKGVAGFIDISSNFPFTEEGIKPDIIMNTSAYPKRMTVGQLIAGIYGKKCAAEGSFGDGAIFNGQDINELGDQLKKLGMSDYGSVHMYDGPTGVRMKYKMFLGINYYVRIEQFSESKLQAVDTCPKETLSRQPVRSSSSGKRGLKLSYLMGAVNFGQGVSRMVQDKMFDDSDGMTFHVCGTCGKYAIVNDRLGIRICPTCGYGSKIRKVESCWVANVIDRILNTSGINTKRHLK